MSTRRDRVLRAAVPGCVPAADFWPRFQAAAPFILRVGLAVAVGWFGLYGTERRLAAATHSRVYLLRQLALAVKLVACFAAFEAGPLRAHLE